MKMWMVVMSYFLLLSMSLNLAFDVLDSDAEVTNSTTTKKLSLRHSKVSNPSANAQFVAHTRWSVNSVTSDVDPILLLGNFQQKDSVMSTNHNMLSNESESLVSLPATITPSKSPTKLPFEPSFKPTQQTDLLSPSYEPSFEPTKVPFYEPSFEPTKANVLSPSYEPSFEPTEVPSYEPSFEPRTIPPYTASPTFTGIFNYPIKFLFFQIILLIFCND